MADTEDDNFDEAFKGFGEDKPPVAETPPVTPPATSPADPAVVPPVTPPVEPPKIDPPKPVEEPKKDEQLPVELPKKDGEEVTPPTDDEKKPKETPKPPETPETPPASEEPAKPLTKDDVKSVVSDLLSGERSSSKELDTTTKEVLDAYYPDGLSNILTTPEGKELRSPADVVEASDNKMSTEEAAQWLMNEQFKLDGQVAKIREDARAVAETTVNFKRDAVAAVQKYEPLFKAYPYLQQKVFDKLMKQVKADKEKNVILSSPDVIEHYDDYLEPYQLAFEHSTKQSATNPTPPATPEPPKPTAEDRMDEGGDGGQEPVNDPNDFAQQVTKELA